jgi:hypothetical protein
MYIKDWFKPILPLFLTGLLHTLKFLIPMVESVSSVTRQALPTFAPHKEEVSIGCRKLYNDEFHDL